MSTKLCSSVALTRSGVVMMVVFMSGVGTSTPRAQSSASHTGILWIVREYRHLYLGGTCMSWSQRLMPFVKLLANSMSSQVIIGIKQSGNGGSGFGFQDKMMTAWESNVMDDDVWHEIAYEAEKFGVESSCFLQVALVNFLWCGSSQVLGHVLPQSMEWMPINSGLLIAFGNMPPCSSRTVCRWTWVHGKWHGKSLGDMCTGREVQNAYKVSWKAIAPHVPGPGGAGRIDLG